MTAASGVGKHTGPIRGIGPRSRDAVPRMQENQVAKAIERFSWPNLRAHLDEVGLDEPNLTTLLGLVRRGDNLIVKRPDPGREASRDAFVAELDAFVVREAGEEASARLHAELTTLGILERGYREILGALDGGPSARMSPESRIGATLARAAWNCHGLERLMEDARRYRREIAPQSFRVPLGNGLSAPPDGILAAVVETTTATMMMEARRSGWVDGDGRIVLPALPIPSEAELAVAGLVEALAVAWRRWGRLDQRCRYLGGRIVELSAGERPEWAPEAAARVVRHWGVDAVEVADFLANARLNARLVQTAMEMMLGTDMDAMASGITGPSELPPGSFVSAAEAVADVSLCQILGYSIADDTERPGGLRLVEWVRGYAALSCLARRRYAEEGPSGLVADMPYGDLVALLERVGLGNGTAEAFISRATLRTSSRDLFDQPLVRTRGGAVLVFGPALLSVDPARVTLSAIGKLGVQLGRKGKAFERETQAFFRERGLAAHAFKARLGGEDFEFDAIVPWGDFVFLFECKNTMLSGHHPVQAYRFDREMRSAIRQVNRQAAALRAHPDLLRTRTGIDPTAKTIVPCVLNSLPYALAGKVDGAYVSDASGVRRFFQERYVHVIRPHHLKKGLTLAHRTAVKSLWVGDAPTPEDLLQNLEEPVALTITAANVEVGPVRFSLGSGTFVEAEDFGRSEVDVEGVATLFGADPVAARRGMEAVTRQVGMARAQWSRRLMREQDRAWRRLRNRAR